jgi:hypothetical protein
VFNFLERSVQKRRNKSKAGPPIFGDHVKQHGKEIMIATVLAATLTLTMVLTSEFIVSQLGGQGMVKEAYAVGVQIEDSVSLSKVFWNWTMSVGGGLTDAYFAPIVWLFYENGSGLWVQKGTGFDEVFSVCAFTFSESGIEMNESGPSRSLGRTFDGNGLQEIILDLNGPGFYSGYSDEFVDAVLNGNFSMSGNYSSGSRIRCTLETSYGTTDFGSYNKSSILLKFDLNATTMLDSTVRFRDIYDVYGGSPVPPELKPVKEINGYWGFGSSIPLWGWAMNSSKIAETVGNSAESASIVFEGSVWLNGNYTVPTDSIRSTVDLNVTGSVSFGSIDMTFEAGEISTLTLSLNTADIILFAYPKK